MKKNKKNEIVPLKKSSQLILENEESILKEEAGEEVLKEKITITETSYNDKGEKQTNILNHGTVIINGKKEEEKPPRSAKMKGVKTYNFFNKSKEIVGSVLMEQEGISDDTLGKIAMLFLKSGFTVEQGTSIEASVLFEKQLIMDQKELFSE